MKRTIVLTGVLALAVFFTFTSCEKKREAAGQVPVSFKLAMADNEQTPFYQAAMKIAEEVDKATNGQIKIEVVAGGALGGERDTVELAINGDLDIASAANSVVTNWIPEMGILDQAYLWSSSDQAHAAVVNGKIGGMIQAKANALSLHVIGYIEAGFRNTFSTVPIRGMADFKGVKIRTMQNQYHMAAFESFGAMPTPMAAGEQFTALQQGTINATENAVSKCWNNRFYEVTKNVTWTNHAFAHILLLMSDKAWNKIPADLRQPFLDAVNRGYQAGRQYLIDANNDAVKELKAAGVSFYDIDVQQLQAAYQAVAKAKGFSFDPAWEAAIQEVINNTK